MLPYLEVAPLRLPGGVSIAPYGVLAVTAVLAGLGFGALHAPRHGLERRRAVQGLWWAVVCGLILADVGDLVLYEPARLETRGLAALFDAGAGLASLPGIAGGVLALWIYAGVTRTPRTSLFDLLAECFTVAWLFGRLGCALAHDHPGRLTSFALAVAFPDGPRHDLGLYEWAYTLAVLAPALWWLDRRRAPEGSRFVVFCLLYGPVRFLLDLLRATDLPGSDLRYAGLTAAQYGCVVLTVIAIGVWLRLAPRWRERSAVE